MENKVILRDHKWNICHKAGSVQGRVRVMKAKKEMKCNLLQIARLSIWLSKTNQTNKVPIPKKPLNRLYFISNESFSPAPSYSQRESSCQSNLSAPKNGAHSMISLWKLKFSWKILLVLRTLAVVYQNILYQVWQNTVNPQRYQHSVEAFTF